MQLVVQRRLGKVCCKRNLVILNVAMAVLVTWLVVSGAASGYTRYMSLESPKWVKLVWLIFPLSGTVLGLSLLTYAVRWIFLARDQQEEDADTVGAASAVPD